ncbi:MAG: hypothetical protein NUW07_05630 [Candidatus Saccharicenans sp.]|nr:hypothetical protein [Candidatus Saccharicenans sp.]MDH7492285.1 hypothetical protein [Candidatus Saccharicenans sp.]
MKVSACLSGWLLSLLLVVPAHSQTDRNEIMVFVSPHVPRPMAGFRVVVVSEREIPVGKLKVTLRPEEGEKTELELKKKGGGPPFWAWWQGRAPGSGLYTLEVQLERRLRQSRQIRVAVGSLGREPGSTFWQTEDSWDREWENLYSAWLEALFLEAGEKDSWPDLDTILKQPERNFLHNHLGQGEDDDLSLKPDCADNPFFLRAYFSWKNRLPFGFHQCSRGSLWRPPEVGRWFHNELPSGPGDETRKFTRLMRLVMDMVHSGTGRTALAEENSDYFPLPLARDWLRPGSVFADPYGHTLVIVRWLPQTESQPGILLAVDAQPDGTVGLKRFWKGNFLFATEEVVGQPGFKVFRPIVRTPGGLKLMSNREIQESSDYGNYSLEQLGLDRELFYSRMERLINPRPLDPETALKELFQALYEQLLVRVESVENGEKYFRANPGQVIPMPSGAAVFLASGPWEDFSTPNRDLRLLIAMDTIDEFPDKVARHPEMYRTRPSEKPEAIQARLKELSAQLARSLKISYPRSDGRQQTLTLEEILKRKEAFEMGYNPNDCPEIRWGAPAGSEEMSSCRRRAPAWQRERMEQLRVWFKKRLHPPT